MAATRGMNVQLSFLPRSLCSPSASHARSPVFTHARTGRLDSREALLGARCPVDLALSLVEDDHGARVARDVARELVVFMARPGGQSQFSARMTQGEARHPVVRQVMDVIVADPAAAYNLESLARDAGVSGRHLGRLFHRDAGMTPGHYLESVRLEAAQGLLEGGDYSVDTVAQRSGFGSSETMRRVFQQKLGITPTAYRARFRTTVEPVGPHRPPGSGTVCSIGGLRGQRRL